MDTQLLKKHIDNFMSNIKENPEKFNKDYQERLELVGYYQSFTKDKILSMNQEEFYIYLSKLWAMRIWGNKHYVVDKVIEDNEFEFLKDRLSYLIWGEQNIEEKWDSFRSEIKGLGPAMISEILCKTHPNDYILWNRRVYIALNYLKVNDLPRYDYQLTGEVYKKLCDVAKEITNELKESGFRDTTILATEYFILDELQVEENLSRAYVPVSETKKTTETLKEDESKFIHNDIRDKLKDIGLWLGFTAEIERKISEGSKVDTIWESTIGNMGRVIYVFEVQTKGSIDSLIVNLLKSLNNPAVQGVVAVSDKQQLELIKKHANDVRELRDKLRLWDYENVLQVHESLEYVNASINDLELVPQGF